jgi:hypothetical protein
MDLANLIEALSNPAAYPQPVERVEVRQTHISVVLLAGPHIYKVKKPVNPGFLDFSTLEKRLHFCREEVRLNRRLAPDVYLGVVPVVQTESGLRLEGAGDCLRRPLSWNASSAEKSELSWSNRWPVRSLPSTAQPRRTNGLRNSVASTRCPGSSSTYTRNPRPRLEPQLARPSSSGYVNGPSKPYLVFVL